MAGTQSSTVATSPEIQSGADAIIPVTQEELTVERRVVDTGHKLRVRKEVLEDVVDVHASLFNEFVDAQRVPIGRVVETATPVRREGDVLVVPVFEERLVTRRELVLVEEVRITRRREVRNSSASVPLRRERVVVERFDPATEAWHATAEGEGGDLAPGTGPPG
jgi:stress response protein YsnF